MEAPLEFKLKDVDAVRALSVRKNSRLSDLTALLSNVFISASELVKDSPSNSISGKIFQLTHALNDDTADVEICVPVAASLQGKDTLKYHEFPAVKAISCIVKGSYDDHLFPAMDKIAEWAKEHGHNVSGPLRTTYLVSPVDSPNENDWVTELQLPI